MRKAQMTERGKGGHGHFLCRAKGVAPQKEKSDSSHSFGMTVGGAKV